MERSIPQLLLGCLVFTIFAAGIQNGSATEISKPSETLNNTIQQILDANGKMHLIGGIDYSRYFTDYSSNGFTFQDASNLCKDAGLKLARLKTQKELIYLRDILNNYAYWVDGYDKNEYSWVQDGGDVFFSVETLSPNCVALKERKLYGYPCGRLLSGEFIHYDFFPLCQLTVTDSV